MVKHHKWIWDNKAMDNHLKVLTHKLKVVKIWVILHKVILTVVLVLMMKLLILQI